MASVVTYFVFRTGLGAVCLLAGLEKARAPRDFFDGVRQYRLVPARLAPIVGGGLIGAELVLGGLLVSGLVPVVAAVGAIVLFSVFAAALAVSLARSNRAPCHCFGASDVETISPLALIRALALAGLAVAVLVFALGDTAWIARGEVLPALLMTAGLVAATRLSGLLPLAWSFLRAEASFYPTPTRRVSFRHQPLTVPLHPRQEER
ncbi:MAG: MauE/DoxX family redox-associated membrane protein [Actinomycetota bacterium]